MRKLNRVLVSVLAGFGLSATAMAGSINWNAPVAITTDGSASDVVNLGTTVVEAQYADGNGAGTQTVNGIPFMEGFSDYASPSGYTAQAIDGTGFTTGNANYDTIIDGFAYDGNNPNTLTLTGLTSGTEYEVQLWSVDDRGCCNGRTIEFDDGNGNFSTKFAEGDNVSTTGTFIASGNTQIVNVNGIDQGQNNLNAFSVQTIAATPVPLPSSAWAGMGLFGGLGVLALRRKKAIPAN